MISAALVSVLATATKLADATTRTSGLHVKVKNTGAATVFLGGADVDATQGFPLAAAATDWFPVMQGDVLFAVTASGTVNVNVLRLADESD